MWLLILLLIATPAFANDFYKDTDTEFIETKSGFVVGTFTIDNLREQRT